MKTIVLFSSKGGNTEKIAKEISSELNCQCVNVNKGFDSSTLDLNDFDLVFVGTGVYAGKPNVDMLNYLNEINLNNSRQFAVFMTWFGRGKSDKTAFDKMKTAIEGKGQKTLQSCYECQGEGHTAMTRGISRLMGHNANGHPNAEELSAARKWAKEVSEPV